ncbi:hypothetical protein M9Y10_013650 [Tritrichomonas musculus]|uniref:DnaK protein n=1 Tax=Tritrichomonas musculus TaxID=1915356 RepID=A0ABR2KXE8_9EUKA
MIFLLALSVFTRSAIFGIDFGNEYIKTSMALVGKKVFVALNQNAKRLSPSYFCFWNTKKPQETKVMSLDQFWDLDEIGNYSWAYFDSAKSHALRYPNHAITGFSPLLENIHGFSRREVLALMLRDLVSTIDDGKWKSDNAKLVFSVEPFMTREERFAIVEAVGLMNGTLTSIIDYPTAAAELYALERRSSYLKKVKKVAFIDIGAKNSWAAIYKFEPTKKPTITELSLSTRRNFGGNNIDLLIANLLIDAYCTKFYPNNKESFNLSSKPSIYARFVEEGRKAKELLSINKDIEIRMEDVEEDKTLVYSLSRDYLNELLTDFRKELVNLYNEVLQKANFSDKDLDSIELIGGVTRIPSLKDALANATSLNKVDRTMNSEEAIALGAGYVGATHSSLFIVKDVNMKSFANCNVSFYHNNTEYKIFNETSYLDETFKYTFIVGDVCNMSDVHEVTTVHNNTKVNKKKDKKKKKDKEEEPVENITVTTDYYYHTNNFSIYADDRPITSFYIQIPNNTKSTAKVSITIGFSDWSIPNLTQIRLRSSLYDLSHAHFTQPEWSLSEEQFNKSLAVIKKMDDIINASREYQQAYNDYESYIYTIKEKLLYSEDFRKVVNESVSKELMEAADEHREWLNKNMVRENLTKEEIKDKHEELKKVLQDAERREEDLSKRNETYEALNKTLNWIHKELTEVWPKKKKWMPRQKVRDAWRNYNSTLKYYNEMREKQANLSDYENPAAWNNQINIQRQILEFNFNQTVRLNKKPTPTPKGWVPPEPTPDPEEEERRMEEEERLNELENQHYEEYRKFMDASHDFDQKYRTLRDWFKDMQDKLDKQEEDRKEGREVEELNMTQDRLRELRDKYTHIYNEFEEKVERKFMRKHSKYVDCISRNTRFLSFSGPQFYNDYYYYYDVLPTPTPDPSANVTELNKTINATVANETANATTTNETANESAQETPVPTPTDPPKPTRFYHHHRHHHHHFYRHPEDSSSEESDVSFSYYSDDPDSVREMKRKKAKGIQNPEAADKDATPTPTPNPIIDDHRPRKKGRMRTKYRKGMSYGRHHRRNKGDEEANKNRVHNYRKNHLTEIPPAPTLPPMPPDLPDPKSLLINVEAENNVKEEIKNNVEEETKDNGETNEKPKKEEL